MKPWTCPSCDTHNRVEAPRCKQCGLGRPPDAAGEATHA